MHGRDLGHRRDDGDGGLAAAGHHVHIGGAQMRIAIHHRDDIGADRRRREIDHDLARRKADFAVFLVRGGAGGVEYDVDVIPFRQRGQAINSVMGGGHAKPGGSFQAVAVRIDAR